MQNLQPNSTLQGGKYKIEKVLGQGGFGITYLAYNNYENKYVAIKEFFLKELCGREESTHRVITHIDTTTIERFKTKFLKEARTLMSFTHRNIVRVFDCFEENNTAYYVMEYIQGSSLSEILRQRESLDERTAVSYIRKVAAALQYIHGMNINHLDVKPGNILLRSQDNEIVLIDFGTAKHYDTATGGATTMTQAGYSQGYAAIEQYRQGGVSTFTPETDIYSLGATLYKMLTNQTPPEPSLIIENGLPTMPSWISASTKSAITAAMQINKASRPHSVSEFLKILDGDEATKVIDESTVVYSPKPTHISQRSDESTHLQPNPTITSAVTNKSNNVQQSNDGTSWGWIVIVVIAIVCCIVWYNATNTNDSKTSNTGNIVSNVDNTEYNQEVRESASTAKQTTVVAEYATYYNNRFNFSVEYPTFLRPMTSGQNEDGRKFARDYDTYMIASASYLSERLSDYYNMLRKSSDTYYVLKSNWFVLSGRNSDGTIYYQKSVVSDDVLYTLYFSYTSAESAQFDKVIKRVLNSWSY